MLRVRTGSILLAVVALAATACGGGDDGDSSAGGGGSKAPLKIGVINPFSGATAPGGIATAQGYELAVDEVNAKGGVLGRQVGLIRGDASTPDAGISEVNRLASSEKVELFLGTYLSGISNTASETAARSNKLYWETNALAKNLTERKLANFFRSGPDSDAFAKVSAEGLAEIVAPNIGKSINGLRVCLSHEQSIYGTSVAEAQQKLLGTAGAVVVDTVAYDPASPDLGNVIIRCQRANTDAWVSTGYVADSNLLLRTATQQGFKPPAVVMVGSADTAETAKAIPDAELSGVYVTAYTHNDANEAYAPGIKDFLAAFQKKYNAELVFPQTTAAYTGAKMLFEALEKAGSTDPAAIKKILPQMKQPLGTSTAGFGQDFNENGQNVAAQPTLTQWQPGSKLVTVYPAEAAPPGAKPIAKG